MVGKTLEVASHGQALFKGGRPLGDESDRPAFLIN
jgi:hypothetical protein